MREVKKFLRRGGGGGGVHAGAYHLFCPGFSTPLTATSFFFFLVCVRLRAYV